MFRVFVSVYTHLRKFEHFGYHKNQKHQPLQGQEVDMDPRDKHQNQIIHIYCDREKEDVRMVIDWSTSRRIWGVEVEVVEASFCTLEVEEEEVSCVLWRGVFITKDGS